MSEVKCYHSRQIGNLDMKNLKMFFMRHLGLILTMIAGYAGMNASSGSDFEKCFQAKKDFVSMCNTGTIDKQFVSDYLTINNNVYKRALEDCLMVKYGEKYAYGNRHQLFQQELLSDLQNAREAELAVKCDQLRKDFIAGLASVQTEGNKAAVIKAFESSLADCK